METALPVSGNKRGMKSVCSREAFEVSSLFVGTHVKNTSITFNLMLCFFVLNNLLQSSLISRLYGFNMHVSAKNSNEHNNHPSSEVSRCTLILLLSCKVSFRRMQFGVETLEMQVRRGENASFLITGIILPPAQFHSSPLFVTFSLV